MGAEICPKCGATLPSAQPADLTSIINQYHAKRAAEVALAGSHTICFVGDYEAEQLAQWCADQGITAFAIKPCPCGYYGEARRECICILSQVRKWRSRKRWQNAIAADIVVECPLPYSDQIERHLAGSRGESTTIVLNRVAQVGERPDVELDDAGRSLLKAAASQLALGGDRILTILEVAATIAALAHASRIEICHLAEALQYRPRLGI